MENKEFNLSEKIHRERVKWKTEVIDAEDVKEFIRLLKEELGEDPSYPRKTIDKLAGEKLTQ